MRNNTDNRVKDYRKKYGFTQVELAEKVGVSRLTIISIEKKNYEPTVGLALKLARVFKCTVEDIFTVGDKNWIIYMDF